MSKKMIVRMFVISLAALVGSLVLGGVAAIVAYAGGGVRMAGPDVVGYRFSPAGITAVALFGVGLLVFATATVLYVVSWIGAMVNAVRLPEPTWFLVVLLTGVFGVGLPGMIAYAVAAPDSGRAGAPPASPDGLRPTAAERRPPAVAPR